VMWSAPACGTDWRCAAARQSSLLRWFRRQWGRGALGECRREWRRKQIISAHGISLCFCIQQRILVAALRRRLPRSGGTPGVVNRL